MDMKNWTHTAGFAYEDPEEGEKAKKELQAVMYIRDSMDWSDRKKVFALYQRMVTTGMFVTTVGQSFLRDIQNFLTEQGGMNESEVPDVPVQARHAASGSEGIDANDVEMPGNQEPGSSADGRNHSVSKRDGKTTGSSWPDRKKRPGGRAGKGRAGENQEQTAAPAAAAQIAALRQKNRRLLTILIILGIAVALMFGITLTGRSPTILNYRTKIMNEYSEWENELNEREQSIRTREAELGITDGGTENE